MARYSWDSYGLEPDEILTRELSVFVEMMETAEISRAAGDPRGFWITDMQLVGMFINRRLDITKSLRKSGYVVKHWSETMQAAGYSINRDKVPRKLPVVYFLLVKL